MIRYELSALVSFALFFMGTVALLLGLSTHFNNPSSRSGRRMLKQNKAFLRAQTGNSAKDL